MRWLLLSLALVLGAAQSEPPTKESGKQQDNQPTKSGEEKADKNKVTSQPFAPASIQGVTKPKDENTGAKGTKKHQWYDTFFEHPTEWLLALFNGLLVFYTARLWFSTKDLVEGAEDTARKELRAYVALDDIFFRWMLKPSQPGDRTIIHENHPPRPRIKVKNFGHTPAVNMTVRINGQWTTMNAPFDKTYEGRNYPAPKQMLAPTQEYETWAHMQGGREFKPLSFYDPNLELIVVYGAITYEDIYHRWLVTRFCYAYDGANRFIPYTDYNREDVYECERAALASLSYT